MMRFLVFIFLVFFSFSSQAGACRQIFEKPASFFSQVFSKNKLNSKKTPHSRVYQKNQRKSRASENKSDLQINDMQSFAEAMSKGMILSKKQSNLLKLYIENYFPERESFISFQVEAIFNLLERHPKLSKPLLHERVLVLNPNAYDAPESLLALVKRLNKSAGRAGARLYQIEANWGYWAKALSFSKKDFVEVQKHSEKNSEESENKAFDESSPRNQFLSFLDNWINSKGRLFLKDAAVDRKERAVFLYKALKPIRAYLKKEGRDIQAISQMMIDLIHSSGFESQFNKDLLKSKSPQDKLRGLYNILEERELLAKELGYENFEKAMEALNIEHPSGSSKNENLYQLLDEIQKEIKSASAAAAGKEEEVFRVRPLSILESPFRGCLGLECSTRQYFEKALDPNYIYFTLTGSGHQSSGHITLVLGKAELEGEAVKTAFVDKIQNIALDMIIPMLEAVRQTLAEEGYRLALPIDAGDHNGLSNSDSIRSYVEQEINSNLESQLTNFMPHPHRYKFNSVSNFSRAESKLSLLEFKAPEEKSHFRITKGEAHSAYPAPGALKAGDFIAALFQLKDSDSAADRVKFLKSFSIMNIMKTEEKIKLLKSASIIGSKEEMESLKRRRSNGIELDKKTRLLTDLVIDMDAVISDSFNYYKVMPPGLNMPDSRIERLILVSFINKSSEDFAVRKRAFFILLEEHRYYSVKNYNALLSFFSDKEQDILIGELYNWKNSIGAKKEFINAFYKIYVNGKNSHELQSVLSSPMGKLIDLSFAGAGLLFAAAARKDLETIDFLIDKGVNINAVDSYGYNIISRAFDLFYYSTDYYDTDKSYIQSQKYELLKFLELLMARGASVALWNKEGESAPSKAMERILFLNDSEALQLLQFFIDHGFDSRSKGPGGQNPLMKIASHGRLKPSVFLKVAEFLTQRGLNINDVSNDNESVLSNLFDRISSPYYSLEDILFIFKELEKKGAKLKIFNSHSRVIIEKIFLNIKFSNSTNDTVLDMLSFLTDRGLNINAKPIFIEAFKALKIHRMASGGEIYDFFKSLIKMGAVPHEKDLEYIENYKEQTRQPLDDFMIRQMLDDLKAEGAIAE